MLTKRIVLGDDVELRRVLENSFFQRSGFALLSAGDAAAALALVEEWGPDLAVLDGGMPGAEALCRRLKEDPLLRSTRLLLVFAAGDEGNSSRCRAAGCDAALCRPLDEAGLLAAICRLLGIVCRAVPRKPVDLPLRYRPAAGKEEDGRAINLNGGGLFVVAARLYPVGTLLALAVTLPASSAPLRARARVTWVNHPEWVKTPGLPAGMGMQFVDFEAGSAELLERFLAALP